MLLFTNASDILFCPSDQISGALECMGIQKMPEPNPPDKEYWSVEAIKPLLGGLSDADWVKLNRAAIYRSAIASMSAEDLLQEALERVLSGQRRCPKNVGILVCLKQTMRSIVSASAKSFSKKPNIDPIPDFEEYTIQESATQEAPKSIEEILCSEGEAQKIKSKIMAIFEHDPTSQMILEGRIEEMSAKEIQSMLEIDQKQYQTKSKYIRRTILKNFPNGWDQ